MSTGSSGFANKFLKDFAEELARSLSLALTALSQKMWYHGLEDSKRYSHIKKMGRKVTQVIIDLYP